MMRHLQVFLIAILAFSYLSVNAQEIKVEDFVERTFDLEARSTGTKRLDSNGNACALIKVQLPVDKAEFEGNKVGDVIVTLGEYKVYLVAGSKKLTIKAAGYLPCEVSFNDFNIDGVKGEVVYRLTLKPESFAPKTQQVQIHVTPSNATVILNGEPLTLTDGLASKVLPFGTYEYRVNAEGYEPEEGQVLNYDAEKPAIVKLSLKKIKINFDAEKVLKVESFEEKLFSLEAKNSGTRRVDSNNKACALIKVQLPIKNAVFEGNKVGDVIETPGEYKVYLVAGSKKLTIKTDSYLPCEVSFSDYGIKDVQGEVVYQLTVRPESPGPKTQQIQIHVTPSDAVVSLNNEPIIPSNGIASKSLPFGTYKYRVEAQGYETQEGQVSSYDEKKPAVVTIILKKIFNYKPTSFYLEGKFQAGMIMGVGASVGAYISNFNIEGTFLLGLAESEEIAWINKKQTSNSGYTYTYKPMFYGIKLGYGISCGQNFRITPQVGIGVSSISGSQVKAGSGTDPDATSCYAVPASVGARFEYFITKNFGLSASPEFGLAVMKSDTYTKLSELSSKVKGFGSGFNARVGIFVSF